MLITEVAVAALIATSGVSEQAPKQKALYGGDLGLVATERCIKDGRDMNNGFVLVSDYKDGYFKVNCQILETTSGSYFASKGFYSVYSPLLKTLIGLFEERGITPVAGSR